MYVHTLSMLQYINWEYIYIYACIIKFLLIKHEASIFNNWQSPIKVIREYDQDIILHAYVRMYLQYNPASSYR